MALEALRAPKRQQVNPPIFRKPGKSQIVGPGDRLEPYRWSAIRAALVTAGSWMSVGGRVRKPTPELGDHVLPVS